MKIAIGIPAYNCEKSIERAINSVLLQTYQDWHLYIVDDASTDNTNLILSNYAENEKITIIKNDINKGVSGTRNVILNTSDECYVAFLDSDDEWYTSKLEKQVEAIHRGYKIVITDYNFVTETKSKPRRLLPAAHQKSPAIHQKFCLSSDAPPESAHGSLPQKSRVPRG